jgi:hypothetical protein
MELSFVVRPDESLLDSNIGQRHMFEVSAVQFEDVFDVSSSREDDFLLDDVVANEWEGLKRKLTSSRCEGSWLVVESRLSVSGRFESERFANERISGELDPVHGLAEDFPFDIATSSIELSKGCVQNHVFIGLSSHGSEDVLLGLVESDHHLADVRREHWMVSDFDNDIAGDESSSCTGEEDSLSKVLPPVDLVQESIEGFASNSRVEFDLGRHAAVLEAFETLHHLTFEFLHVRRVECAWNLKESIEDVVLSAVLSELGEVIAITG